MIYKVKVQLLCSKSYFDLVIPENVFNLVGSVFKDNWALITVLNHKSILYLSRNF